MGWSAFATLLCAVAHVNQVTRSPQDEGGISMRSASERPNQAWCLLLYTDHERDLQNSVSGGLFLLALPYRKDVPRLNCGAAGLSMVTACKRLARADFV